MINLKKILSVDTAVKVGSLGAGSLGARYVLSENVAGKILKTEQQMKFAPALPIIGGVVISQGKSAIAKGVGFGMVAQAAGDVLAGLVDKDGLLGLNGNVMIGTTDPMISSTYSETPQATQTASAPGFSHADTTNEMAY